MTAAEPQTGKNSQEQNREGEDRQQPWKRTSPTPRGADWEAGPAAGFQHGGGPLRVTATLFLSNGPPAGTQTLDKR